MRREIGLEYELGSVQHFAKKAVFANRTDRVTAWVLFAWNLEQKELRCGGMSL